MENLEEGLGEDTKTTRVYLTKGEIKEKFREKLISYTVWREVNKFIDSEVLDVSSFINYSCQDINDSLLSWLVAIISIVGKDTAEKWMMWTTVTFLEDNSTKRILHEINMCSCENCKDVYLRDKIYKAYQSALRVLDYYTRESADYLLDDIRTIYIFNHFRLVLDLVENEHHFELREHFEGLLKEYLGLLEYLEIKDIDCYSNTSLESIFVEPLQRYESELSKIIYTVSNMSMIKDWRRSINQRMC